MERTRDLERHDLAGAGVLQRLGGRGDTLMSAGDDHLRGGVVVGDPHALDAVDGRRDRSAVHAQDRGHGAGGGDRSGGHQLAALDHELEARLDREHPSDRKGSQLTE